MAKKIFKKEQKRSKNRPKDTENECEREHMHSRVGDGMPVGAGTCNRAWTTAYL
jgi:hypothetical protein